MTRPADRRPRLFCAASLARPVSVGCILLALFSHVSDSTAHARRPAAPPQIESTRLPELGGSTEREVTAGALHRFHVDLAAGQFLRLGITPSGIDLRVSIKGPDGSALASGECRGAGPASDPLAFVAVAAGRHVVEVSAEGAPGRAGRYRIGVEELRASAPQDQARVAAERAQARAVRLQFEGGRREDLRAAVKFYEEAHALWRGAGERREEARALGALGAVLSSLGDGRAAVGYYVRAADLYGALGDRRQEAALTENIGRLQLDPLRDRESALEYLARSLELYRATGHRAGQTRALTLLGQTYTDLGAGADDFQKSLGYFAQALAAQRAERDPYGEGDSLARLMLAWRRLRRARPAIFYGKQAVNAFQSLRTGMKDLERETQRTFLKSKEETYRVLADLLISEGRLPEAQQVLEMLKEEEYFDYIRRDGSGAAGLDGRAAATAEEAELEKKYREIAENIAARGRMRGELLKKPARTPAEERQLGELDTEISVAQRAFEKFLDQLAEELGDTKKAARVDTLREAQGLMADLRELGGHSVALYTLVGEEKYRLVLVTPDVQKAYEYPIGAAELARKVAAFRETLQNPARDPLPLARELYRIIVGPAARDLEGAGAETLMWSLDGVLRYVPVAALHDGEKYLVERYRSAVFTPASHARLKDQPRAKWKGVGFGVSKPYEGFPALPSVPAELRGIIREESEGAEGAGVLPGRVLLDALFTEESMKAELRSRYTVVHIASHFNFKPGNETNSFLLLGDGQHLSLARIKNSLDFGGVELLTLSACDTATGGAGSDGKEVEGFAMLAQRQGAKAVVASLWPVADRSTQLLMQNFYRVRDAEPGLPKAEAMRRAQLALLRGEVAGAGDGPGRGLGVSSPSQGAAGRGVSGVGARAAFSHPFFWAPFILIGNWR